MLSPRKPLTVCAHRHATDIALGAFFGAGGAIGLGRIAKTEKLSGDGALANATARQGLEAGFAKLPLFLMAQRALAVRAVPPVPVAVFAGKQSAVILDVATYDWSAADLAAQGSFLA